MFNQYTSITLTDQIEFFCLLHEGDASVWVERPAVTVAHRDGHWELDVPGARLLPDQRPVDSELPSGQLPVGTMRREAAGVEDA